MKKIAFAVGVVALVGLSVLASGTGAVSYLMAGVVIGLTLGGVAGYVDGLREGARRSGRRVP